MQFVLPATWTYGRKYGITFEQLASWWSEKPAKLAGLTTKVSYRSISKHLHLLYASALTKFNVLICFGFWGENDVR